MSQQAGSFEQQDAPVAAAKHEPDLLEELLAVNQQCLNRRFALNVYICRRLMGVTRADMDRDSCATEGGAA